jgi:LuxR family transcriptional regulator, maltose regulon positive regulatory protein
MTFAASSTVTGSTGTGRSERSGGVVVRRELLDRLSQAGRVTEVSGPAGSGKSVLLRSWIDEAAPAGQAAQVSVQDDDRDPGRFCVSVAGALRGTAAGAALVRPLTEAPDGWAAVEQLLADLGALRDRIWLVIDDVHTLGSADVLRQLEQLLTRAPAGLRFVLSSRHNLRLGLHRLRLEGELTEIRAASLRFSRDEARALFEAAGVAPSESALALLHERTEGWAAGLRLAALSLTGHPDPERFAAEFCGSERTVAEYLLAEVLERQSEEVRRLLSRTSVLERVSGPLADLLTGGSGGEQILQKLEQAGAFVVALDARRSWFRYHRLFADLLELELRHTEPAELATLHGTAAGWFAEHRLPAEAVRHAQAAQDWERAGRLLADHWLDVIFTGQAATAHQLITWFPAGVVYASAELTAVAAATELMRGSLAEGARYLELAAAGAASVPAGRRERFRVTVAVLRLYLARQLGDAQAVAEQAGELRSADALDAAQLGLGEDLRAIALVSLGVAELWSSPPRFSGLREAEAHLERGIAVARRHGWSGAPLVAIAYPALASSLIWRGELEEAERWLAEGEHGLQPEADQATRMLFQLTRGFLELARGRAEAALGALRAAGRPAGCPQAWLTAACLLEASARDELGEREAAGHALERALDLAEPDGLLVPFLLHPAPGLLDRHARQRTAHPALLGKIISALGGSTPAAPAAPPQHLPEPLSQAEARVLRFLPTSLSAPEIAGELYVSVNTVRTHMRHLYDKLGAHRRLEAIDRARALGLLTPVPQRA